MPREARTDASPVVITEPRYLKLEDVATYLSVSVPQVYALVCSGELPAIVTGLPSSVHPRRTVYRILRRRIHRTTGTDTYTSGRMTATE